MEMFELIVFGRENTDSEQPGEPPEDHSHDHSGTLSRTTILRYNDTENSRPTIPAFFSPAQARIRSAARSQALVESRSTDIAAGGASGEASRDVEPQTSRVAALSQNPPNSCIHQSRFIPPC